ncbi:ATP-binding cassette sub-family B member 10, mitochondrial [Teleopsis dalmanni]|uniref:ATP-binding cassette sub-family B member 10, mitochondrial n=1 Tax=Teleopsis dalmanni TaxID=139649 RepID=UPI0018CE0CAD|nr:ATP-binding cassette sub-family B member 10, mitochondrial [Teleopsis dalmanni]
MLIYALGFSKSLSRYGSVLLAKNLNKIPTLPTTFSRSILTANRNGHLLLRSTRHPLQPLRFQGTTIKTTQPKVKLKSQDVMRLLSLAKSEKLVLTVAIGCLVISSGITMCVPFALGKIMDIIFNKDEQNVSKTLESLKQFSLILLGVFIVGGLANFGRVYLFNAASLRIVKNLRSLLYRRMLHQESSWFDTKGSGELVNRLSNDAFFIGNALSQNVSDGLRSIVMVVAGTGMMIYTSPELALISTAVVPCLAGMAIIYGRFVRTITKNLLDKFADIMKSAEERFGNIKTVKTFSKENEESKFFDEQLTDALQIGYKEVKARSIFFGLTGFSGNAIIISVLYYGGSLVMQDALTVGALTSFILYAGYSAVSINGLSNFYTELNKGVGAAQRIWEIIDRKHTIPIDTGLEPIQRVEGRIDFQNVCFTFPERIDSTVLKNLNLTLWPGQTTAVVGRSGSGKSTIAALLLRLYDPQSGCILLDGIDIKQVNPIWLRSHISAVQQEPVLFSGTIRENILYGAIPGTVVSEELFQNVIRKSYVHEFAQHLPDGLNTLVGQRGLLLSGGQKQRVAIARALIKQPSVLILDEATSALDSVSEELVQKSLENISKGLTVLTIAHRLSTIRNAHKIVVLDNGSVSEEGDYGQLMISEKGTFKELIEKQTFELKSVV